MKVIVIGGYGVFGGRLARLLLRDGHDIWIAGRNLRKAAEWTARHGGQALRLDLDGDLTAIEDLAPDVVVDAAGPFQACRDDPYRAARFCLAHGIHWLDLSDDPRFTAGIGSLDDLARDTGCFALSGVSSVPAISSEAVSALAVDLDRVDLIESAIMPGNRAPRGQSVIAGILSQMGKPMPVWRGGRRREIRTWSDRRTYLLEPGLRRPAWTISVPDLVLFPAYFGAQSVMFRAGMELGILNRALSVFSVLRRWGWLGSGQWQVVLAHRVSALLMPFGSDRGGMIVDVTGEKEGQTVRRRWQLIAEAGEGPFVPGVAVRTLLRRAERIPPGARPCLAETGLAEIEAAMADLAVRTSRSEAPRPPLFQAALKEGWQRLPPAVRRWHEVQDMESFSGRAGVERGSGPVARLVARLLRFPQAGEEIPLTLVKTRMEEGEIWVRNFAGRSFQSHLTGSKPYHYRERCGALVCEMEMTVRNGRLHMQVRRGRFLGIPLPRFLLPRSEACEWEADGELNFDVALFAPPGRSLVLRYRGAMWPDREEVPPGQGLPDQA